MHSPPSPSPARPAPQQPMSLSELPAQAAPSGCPQAWVPSPPVLHQQTKKQAPVVTAPPAPPGPSRSPGPGPCPWVLTFRAPLHHGGARGSCSPARPFLKPSTTRVPGTVCYASAALLLGDWAPSPGGGRPIPSVIIRTGQTQDLRPWLPKALLLSVFCPEGLGSPRRGLRLSQGHGVLNSASQNQEGLIPGCSQKLLPVM